MHPKLENEAMFTLEELHTSMAQLKKRKAAAPDGILNELWMLLDDHDATLLLELYNHAWCLFIKVKGTIQILLTIALSRF